jgi:hypothetical protein
VPENEISLNLDTKQASAALADLDVRMDRLMSKMTGFTSGVGGVVSPEVQRAYGGALGGAGASSNVAATATSTPAGGVTNPQAAASAFLAQNIKGFPAGAPVSPAIAAQLAAAGFIPSVGASPSGPTSSGAATGVQNVAMTAATQQWTQTLRLPAAPTMAMPAGGGGMYGPGYLDTTTMMMPAWSAPFQQSAYPNTRAISFNNAGLVPTQRLSPMQLPGWSSAYRDPFTLGPMGSRFAGGAAIAAGQAFTMAGQEMVSGRTDIMGGGQLAGATVGGFLGLPFGPVGMATGAALGGGVGSWLAAPVERTRQIMASLYPVAGAFDGVMSSRTLAWADQRADAFRAGSNMRTFSVGAVGAMYSSAISALYTGGIEPLSDTGFHPMFRDPIPAGDREKRGGAGGLIAGLNRTVANTIRGMQDIAAGHENLAQTIVRRVGMRYPDESAATDVMNRIAPIYGDLPASGGNIADILKKHGPLDTFRYLQSQVEPGMPEAVPRDVLRDVSASYRRGDRELSFAGMQVRGGGSATSIAARRQMRTLASLPGGRDSLAYMEAFTTARAGSLEQFDDDLNTRFGIPQLTLHENLARAAYAPYNPGGVIGAKVGLVRSQMGEANEIDAFTARRRAAGELSVSEEMSLRSRSASARISAFQGLGEIAEGGPNLLPGVNATGAFGAGLHRFTGAQQASLFINPFAPWRRDVGFNGGRGQNRSNAFYEGVGMPAAPFSRSEGVNNGGAMGDPRVVALLERIARALDRGAGSFERPNRGAGDLNAQTGPRGWGGP